MLSGSPVEDAATGFGTGFAMAYPTGVVMGVGTGVVVGPVTGVVIGVGLGVVVGISRPSLSEGSEQFLCGLAFDWRHPG